MKLSIIIPIYQVESYIERCLTSIVNQGCNDCEIILVDDASTDSSMAIARNVLKDSDVNVQFLKHETNSGLSAARNTGIRAANADYLLFVDSDDSLADGALSAFIRFIDESNADCIVGNYKVVSDEGEYVSKKYGVYRSLDFLTDIRLAYSMGDIPIMAWNKCIKTELVRNKNLYFKEGICHEDELWTFLLVNNIESLVLTGVCSYTYYIRGGSIMTNAKKEFRLRSSIVVYSEMVNYILNDKCDNQSILNSMDAFAFCRYKDIFNNVDSRSEAMKMYADMREMQKKVKRGSGKYGVVAAIHLTLPCVLGASFVKFLVKYF